MFTRISKLEAHHQTMFAIIIALAVIAFSRGVTGLLDLYLFPNQKAMSFLWSVVVGLIILLVTHYAVKAYYAAT